MLASVATGRPAAAEPRRANLERSQSLSAFSKCGLLRFGRDPQVLHAIGQSTAPPASSASAAAGRGTPRQRRALLTIRPGHWLVRGAPRVGG